MLIRLIYIGLWCTIWVGIQVGPLAPCAHAQRGVRGGLPPAELIEAPREVRRLLQEATDGIEKKRWSESTYALGLLLGLEQVPGNQELLSQDYFLADQGNADKPTSVRQVARELLAKLPSEGAKLAEVRFGTKARTMLDRAVEQDDWATVTQVARDYGFTEAGIEASYLVAEYEIGRGELFVAARRLDDLLLQPAARQRLGLGIGVLAAACWKAVNQRDQAIQSIQQLQSVGDSPRLSWRGQPLSLGQGETGARAVVESLSSESFRPNRFIGDQWQLPLGMANRNGEAQAGLPLPFIRWETRLHESAQQEDVLIRNVRANAGNSLLLPARIPLVLDQWVVAQTYDQRLLGINMKTGKIEWQNVFGGLPVNLDVPEILFNERRSNQLDYRVWGDLTTGLLSSDGERIYHVSNVAASAIADSLIGGNARPIPRASRQTITNVMQSYGVDEQGKLLWEVGGETGLAEPRLANVFFLGPAVPYESELIALADVNGEIYILSLIPATGKLNWMQSLAATNGMVSFDEAMQQIGAMPSISGGIAICPGLNGYLFAYDLVRRNLLWSKRLNVGPVEPMDRALNMQFRSSRTFNLHSSHSVDNGAVIANGTVYYLKADAVNSRDNVYAMHLLSGKQKWQFPSPADNAPSDLRYIAGVTENCVLMVGDRGMVGLSAADGTILWQLPFDKEDTSRIAGHGVRLGDKYYLPLANQEIVEISIKDGKILNRARVEKPIGNLVAASDMLFSLSPFELTAYALRGPVQSELDSSEPNRSESPWTLARLSETLLADGKIREALDAVERANQMLPKNDELQLLMMKVGLAALRSDFASYHSRVKQFEELMELGPERGFYLASLVRGYVDQKQWLPAFERLLQLSENRDNRQARQRASNELFDMDAHWAVNEDRWIGTEAQRIYAQATEAERATIRTWLQQRIPQVMQSSLAARRRFIQEFSTLPETRDLQLKTADDLIAIGELVGAEYLLYDLSTNPFASAEDEARRRLVQLYRTANRPLFAAHYQQQLRAPLDSLAPLQTQPERPSLGMQKLENLKLAERKYSDWPKGMVRTERSNREVMMARNMVPCTIQNGSGQLLGDWTIAMKDMGVTIECPWGLESWDVHLDRPLRAPFPEPMQRAFVHQSLIFLELSNEIVAVDTLRASANARDGLLWRQALGRVNAADPYNTPMRQTILRWGEQITKDDRGYEILTVSSDGVIVSTGGEMYCLDLLTGKRVWTRRGFSQPIFATANGHELFVIESNAARKSCIDMRDGKLLSRDPWKEEFNYFTASGPHFLWERFFRSRDLSLKLTDAKTDRIVLEHTFPAKTVASVCENRYFVAVQPDGKAVLWDLYLGKEYEQNLNRALDLRAIKVVRFDDSLIVLPHEAQFDISDMMLTLTLPSVGSDRSMIDSATSNVIVRGHMFAMSAVDGHLLWNEPVPVYDMGFPLLQSRKSPGLTLIRQFKWTAPTNERRDQSSIVVIDHRTGQTVYANHKWDAIKGDVFSTSVTPMANRLDVRFSGQNLALTWTDDPAPPAPISVVGRTSEVELSASDTFGSNEVEVPGMRRPGEGPSRSGTPRGGPNLPPRNR